MSSREIVRGTLRRASYHVASKSRRMDGQYACTRCLSTTPAASFSATQPGSFAFKWFKRTRSETDIAQDRWDDILARLRVRGEMSSTNVSQMMSIIDTLHADAKLPSYDQLLQTLKITLRTLDETHADLSYRLYALLNSAEVSDKPPETHHKELNTLMPELSKALAISGHDQDAITLCANASAGHRQPLVLWRALLEAYRDDGNLVGFLKVRDFMTTHGQSPDVAIINIQLELLSSSKLFEDAQLLYNSMSRELQVAPNWQTRLIMLDVCMSVKGNYVEDVSHHDNVTLGQDIYRKINHTDLKDHPQECYPRLLAWIVFNAGKLDSIHNKIKEMTSAGFELDITIVDGMLYAATLAEQWLLVERLWTSLASSQILPSNNTFSLRMAASVMAGDTNGAKRIFEDSKTAGYVDMLEPLALQTLLAAEMMGQQSDDEFCLSILQLLEKMQPFPITATSLQFLIPKMIERKHFARLENILEMSRQRPDWSSENTITIILDQVAEAKEDKAVWNLHVLLKNLFWNDPLYDLDCRTVLLKKLIKLNSPQMTIKLFGLFLKSTVKPDDRMYINMLQGGIEMRDFDLIRRVHQSMKMDVNLSEHTAILNTLMNAYAHVNSSLTFDVWEQISRSGRGPTQPSVSIVMDACNYSRQPIKGQHIWRSLERQNFHFNDNNYASFVEMLNKHESTGLAMEVLKEALDRGEDVGGRAVSTLYNTAADKNAIRRWAEEACPELWARLQ